MNAKEQFIILTANDGCEKADAVVLLEGDGFNRIATACALVKNGVAGKLVFSGGLDNEAYGGYTYEKCLPVILNEGVAEHQVIPEIQSQHTRQQAEYAMDICVQQGWKKIILVATHYHQFRAFLTFLKVLQERGLDRTVLIVNVAAQADWFEMNTWGRRIDLLGIEFRKIEQYRQQGHIASFEDAVQYYQWRMNETISPVSC